MEVPAQPVFAVRTVDRGDTYVVAPIGELDLATTADLTQALALARRSRAGVIVVDLGRLTFVDSSGVQTLATAHRALSGRLILANAAPAVHHVFELAGLSALLGDAYAPPRTVAAASSRRDSAALATAIRRLRTRRPKDGQP